MDLEQSVLRLEQTSNLYQRLLIVEAKTLAMKKSPQRTAILKQVEGVLNGSTQESVNSVAKLIRPDRERELYVEYNPWDHTWSEACTQEDEERIRDQFISVWSKSL